MTRVTFSDCKKITLEDVESFLRGISGSFNSHR